MEGTKYDTDKNRLELLSPHALWALGEVATYGAKKYKDRNWELGMNWGRVLGAVLRHIMQRMKGEINDPESGFPHLAHAMWGCMVLLDYQITGKGTNDIDSPVIEAADPVKIVNHGNLRTNFPRVTSTGDSTNWRK